MTVTDVATFPAYLVEVRELVESHKQLDEEELLLALYYAPSSPQRPPQDVFLFEVYAGYRQYREFPVSPDRNFQEVLFGSTDAFPLGREQHLHIVLTNPEELEVGMRENWPLAQELRAAIRRGDYREIFISPSQDSLLERCRG